MFLLRSAFWLTVAFLVLTPRADLSATAGALSSQAMAAGQHVIAEQITSNACTTLQCQGGKAAISAILSSNPSVDSTMQDSSSAVPFPRPRPHWMG
jgi:hypothetical protein